MFRLQFVPRRNPKSGQARDGDYSWRTSPLREPMPSEPSRTGEVDDDDIDEAGLGEVSSAVALESATAGGSPVAEDSLARASFTGASVTFSKNVADGTKKRPPVTARLKSSRRS